MYSWLFSPEKSSKLLFSIPRVEKFLNELYKSDLYPVVSNFLKVSDTSNPKIINTSKMELLKIPEEFKSSE